MSKAVANIHFVVTGVILEAFSSAEEADKAVKQTDQHLALIYQEQRKSLEQSRVLTLGARRAPW